MIDKKIIYDLKKLPLFNISLSSKELFHSNFIGWLIEEYPDKMSILFSNLLKKEVIIISDEEKRGIVDREKKDIDLTIYLKNNKKIIIENKVKSLPDYEQLKKYSEKFDENNTNFIILSLIKPDWLNNNSKKFSIKNNKIIYNWFFINYETLSKELDNLNIKNNYVKDYIKFISLLSTLSNKFKINSKQKIDFFSYQQNYKLMNSIRIHDIFHKSIYYQLKTLFDERIKNKYPNLNIKSWNYFSNGTGSIDCGLILIENDKNEAKLDLHFQLQDNNLKLYFVGLDISKFITKISTKLLDEYYAILPKIFKKYNLKSKKLYPINKYNDPLKYGLNHYGKTTYYRNIKLDENLTINQILEIMELLLQHIIKSKKLQEELIYLNK